ncbi:ABC transporter permease [Blautia liquoris]|uniref:ABC transporter permease n=1 Tax=Blautia liquoris TaxID=2779518 RepID=A0A7M2RH24_9FIRM|nr:ABC transporter permease [Blautia liquoris]QOV18847.1 ABC transporter permease [Blautia liquoris]
MISASIISPTLRVSTPILLCALGGVYSERSGTGNITYEGSMLMATFTGVVGSYFTGSSIIGVLCALLGGVFTNIFYGVLRLQMGGDNVVCGFAINSFALGATTYLLRTLFKTSGTLSDPKIQGLHKISVPILKDIPVIKYFFTDQTLLVYIAFIMVFVTQLILKRTKFGMNIRACGENPMAATAVGINVTKNRWISITITGILCGLGGAQMSLGNLTQFSEDMVGGRGFIALAAVMLSNATPIGVMFTAVLFGFAEALANVLQLTSISSYLVLMIPYITVILILILQPDRIKEIKTKLKIHKNIAEA